MASYNLDSAIAMRAAALNAIRVHARGGIGCELPKARLLTAIKVDVFQVERMDVSRDLTCQGQLRSVLWVSMDAWMRLTYPSRVKQMFTKRSAPHPATIKTPTGGTKIRQ